MSSSRITHYEILGIHSDATEEQIKLAHKDLMMIWHPDKCVEWAEDKPSKDFVIEMAKRVNEARAVLLESTTKQRHDELIRDNPPLTMDETKQTVQFRENLRRYRDVYHAYLDRKKNPLAAATSQIQLLQSQLELAQKQIRELTEENQRLKAAASIKKIPTEAERVSSGSAMFASSAPAKPKIDGLVGIIKVMVPGRIDMVSQADLIFTSLEKSLWFMAHIREHKSNIGFEFKKSPRNYEYAIRSYIGFTIQSSPNSVLKRLAECDEDSPFASGGIYLRALEEIYDLKTARVMRFNIRDDGEVENVLNRHFPRKYGNFN